jgi:hypothetical protein
MDEGIETVLDNLERRAGVGGITLAVAYHHGRDIFPHNPVQKVRFLEGGAVFFRPELDRYERLRIHPHVSKLAQECDVLDELVTAVERRSMAVHAWTVFLHNSTLGARYPDCVCRNAFGDPYFTELCPANPDVRAYVTTLATDIARYGVHTIVAESLHYHPLEHGFHHERYLIELGAIARYLLGLCFCHHCRGAARRRDVDVELVQDTAREEVARVFDEDPKNVPSEVDLDEVARLAGGEMGRYLEARNHTVASLVTEVREALVDSGTRVAFMDLSGAVKGYATGRPTGNASASISWRLGVNLPQIATSANELEVIGYAFDPERLRFDVEAYRADVRERTRLALALRPLPPDCESTENLAEKIGLARELGITRVDFYHYGFMRLRTLDRIQEALSASR